MTEQLSAEFDVKNVTWTAHSMELLLYLFRMTRTSCNNKQEYGLETDFFITSKYDGQDLKPFSVVAIHRMFQLCKL